MIKGWPMETALTVLHGTIVRCQEIMDSKGSGKSSMEIGKLMGRTILRQLRRISPWWQNYQCRWLASNYHIGDGWKRIYFYHVRKAAGTSLNQIFLSLGGEEGSKVYARLSNLSNHCIVSGEKIFVGWNRRLIETGNYFYAFSHIPAHQLCVPERTYTFTCLRDPVDRVLSHYKMLLQFRQSASPHISFREERKWLGDGFADFLSRIPKEHFLNQLYMFSETFDLDEAFNRVMSCSHVLFVENFGRGVEALSSKLNIHLPPIHIRKSSVNVRIGQEEMQQLRTELEAEYALYDRLKRALL